MNSRRFFVPEVVQTSSIDCGPACLSALLGGFGLFASYGHLREACQTGVDGASIDTLEQLANQLGLEAEQIVLPADHIPLLEAAALPAIALVRLPNGLTHFVIAWQRHGRRLQVMDPATGRHWPRIEDFAKTLYIHEMTVPAVAWREWAASQEFTAALHARIRALGITGKETAEVIAKALLDPLWRPIATLDAAVRMLQSLDTSGAFKDPSRMLRWLNIMVEAACQTQQEQIIPRHYWSVQPLGDQDALLVSGAVLVRAKGRGALAADPATLLPEVAAAVRESPLQALPELWQFLKRDGVLAPAMIGIALLASAAGIVLQALLFRALLQGGQNLSTRGERLGAIVAILLLLGILLAIDIPTVATLVAMGRRLETRLREAFLRKLPRIADHYFHSRLTSDMAERNHSLHNIRALPALGGQLLRSAFELILTTAAVIWIDASLWPLAILSAAVAVGLPIAVQPFLGERELRSRTHGGALSRFYLDALLGLIPIRTHAGEAVVRGEHRNLLAKWASAGLETQKVTIALEGVQLLTGFGLAALLAIAYVSHHPESSALLLLVYWSLNIPGIGREIAKLACEYPLHRNVALRLLEPLNALETQVPKQPQMPSPGQRVKSVAATGISISMNEVSVVAGGHTILHDISLKIEPGSHVAVIGPSGAGKSSFIGLMLGWSAPASGTLLADNEDLAGANLDKLRLHTSWIDPSIQLWNCSLLDNLRYGLMSEAAMPPGQAVDAADLISVVERLPEGLQTTLGDGGALVSGGEGQRVRLGRAMLRPGVRLVLLDEPFRGLDASARQELLADVRRLWRNATLLFVTHDIAHTRSFDRVLVMDAGAIVEDGAPAELSRLSGSRYSALLRREAELKRDLLQGAGWRRVNIENGVLSETFETSAALRRERAL